MLSIVIYFIQELSTLGMARSQLSKRNYELFKNARRNMKNKTKQKKLTNSYKMIEVIKKSIYLQ